jgi:AcrR family transcriptional regulator
MPGPQRRDQILDACRTVIDTEGFAAATINRIAADCGVTRTVIYQQFVSHAGMLVALIDREWDRAAMGFAEGAGIPGTPHRTFREGVAGVLAAVDANPATWRLLLMPPEGGPPELFERIATARANVRAYLSERIQTPRGRGVPDVELSARTLHAVLDEIVRLRLTDPAAYPTSRLLDHCDWLSQQWLGPSRKH